MSNLYKNIIEWQKRNPEKSKAHRAVNYAIKTGKLTKGACEVCGSNKSEGHHEDYSKPLEVRWLCREHHLDAHYKDRKSLKINNPELELLAFELELNITGQNGLYGGEILSAIQMAYNFGKRDKVSQAHKDAARENGKRGGRPRGSKDKSGQPRTRRSKAQVQENTP